MANTIHRSRIMAISWDIQKNKNRTRSKALLAAWAIFSNEDITVKYLSLKMNRNIPLKPRALNQMGLFSHQQQ